MPTRTRRRLREHTVGLLARKWTLRIAVTLNDDTKRHSELAKCLPGITQKVLTETLREMERTGIVERFVYPVVPHSAEFGMNYYPHRFDLSRVAIAGFVDRQTQFGYGDPLLVVNGQISWEDEHNKATSYFGISNPNNEGFRLTGGQWVRYAERVDNGEQELISWFDDESRAILFDNPISYEQSAYEALVRASRTFHLLDTSSK